MTRLGVRPGPPPPYSAGMSTDSQPSLVISVTNCVGYSPFASSSRQYMPGTRAQTSRTASRMSNWSAVSEKSMRAPRLVLAQAENPGRVLAQHPVPHRAGQIERLQFGEAPFRGQEREVAAPQELAGQPATQFGDHLRRDAAGGPAGGVRLGVGLLPGPRHPFPVPQPSQTPR